jgi:hypothetical protein
VRVRKLRDLRVNLIKDTTDWVEHPELCTAGDAAEGRRAFTPARWSAFKEDVAFFRRVSFAGPYWNGMQTDHGYNPPPVWGLLGRFFSDLHPADVTTMKLLASIDPILMAAMFGMIAWAFGWRVVCVALLFFGTQDASPFFWTGGAFLRQDWLFCTLASACLVRKKHYFSGGTFLAYGTMLRVFPLFFFCGWLVVAAAYAYRKIAIERIPLSLSRDTFCRVTPPHLRRVAAGAAVGALALFAATIPVTGFSAWRSFVHHISVHNETALTNHMGWKTIVSHSAEGRMQIAEDPRLQDHFQTWKAMRTERKRNLRFVVWGGTALMMGAFVLACWRTKSLWVVEALGCLPATVLIELTDYYYSFFLFGALLSRGRRTLEIALVAASIASEWCHIRFRYFDDRFVAMSMVFTILALFMVAVHLRSIRALDRGGVVATLRRARRRALQAAAAPWRPRTEVVTTETPAPAPVVDFRAMAPPVPVALALRLGPCETGPMRVVLSIALLVRAALPGSGSQTSRTTQTKPAGGSDATSAGECARAGSGASSLGGRACDATETCQFGEK